MEGRQPLGACTKGSSSLSFNFPWSLNICTYYRHLNVALFAMGSTFRASPSRVRQLSDFFESLQELARTDPSLWERIPNVSRPLSTDESFSDDEDDGNMMENDEEPTRGRSLMTTAG